MVNTHDDADMSVANKVRAALVGAQGFLKLRDEVGSILTEYLSYSLQDCEITGHDEAAERIIVLFADLLTERSDLAPALPLREVK